MAWHGMRHAQSLERAVDPVAWINGCSDTEGRIPTVVRQAYLHTFFFIFREDATSLVAVCQGIRVLIVNYEQSRLGSMRVFGSQWHDEVFRLFPSDNRTSASAPLVGFDTHDNYCVLSASVGT
jgi:hypothetical protein